MILKKFSALFLTVFIVLFFENAVFAEDNIKIPILMYHNINDNYNVVDRTVEMTVDEFKDQMSAIKTEGYTPISFGEYFEYKNGSGKLPDKPIIITFDDGYLNNYTVAYPFLKEMNMKATIFIITGRMGMQNGVKYPHFTWEQAKQMQDSGIIDIESHTDFHNELNNISQADVNYELRMSRYLIYKNLGKVPTVLAYPYGYYNEYVMQAAKSAGYLGCVRIVTENPGVNTLEQNPYELKRITAYGGMNGAELIDSIKYNMNY